MRFIILCFLMFYTTPAYAQNAIGLKIEELFSDIEELYTQDKPDMGKVLEFFKLHISDEYKSTLEHRSNLSKKVIASTQNREEYLIELQDTSKELLNSTMSLTITNIEYLDDNLSANVSYTTLFSGDIKMNVADVGLSIVKFKSLFVCTELFKLEKAILKTREVDCDADTLYSKPKPIE